MKISIWNLAHVITSRTSPTVQWWMAQMTCFRPRTVLLGVRTMGDVMGENVPQKLQPWSLSTIMLLWHSFLIIIIITLGSNRPKGGFPPNRGNITPLWLFCCTVFFLDPAPRSGTIVTLNGSNDVFPPKDGPFGGQDDGWRHGGKCCPKTPQIGAWIGSFKPKCQNLYIAISPELLIRRTSDLRSEFRPRKAHRGWSAISPKQIQYGRHLENWYHVIFQRRMSDLDEIR